MSTLLTKRDKQLIEAQWKRYKEEGIRHNAEICLLETALDASLKLQAHYGTLLNQWDGGKRMIFKDRDEWIRRLIETKTIKINLETS